MMTLQFADTHNLVAFLSKPAESKGFEQIVDFLNANPIRYALTINPTIYTSCIEQFWATIKAKTVNGEVQLQALVDGKKIIITESICLSAKTTAWNEFSSTMASAIICLATNQKFDFSKYIFESMVKNLENVSGLANFMDPHHTPTIIQPSTSQPQKKQRSRRSKRKDTEVPQPSGPTTNVADEAVNEEMYDSLVKAATIASSLETEQDSGSGPRRQETIVDTIAQTRSKNASKLSNDPLLARGNTLRSGEDSLKLKELMELCTNLQQRVLDLEKTKTTQQNEIASLKRRVKTLK
ncbi:hypothetical protein Tco_0497674 [Tanacetum coccineum]